MKSKIITGVAAAIVLAGCTTDPYTGEQRLSNTAGSFMKVRA